MSRICMSHVTHMHAPWHRNHGEGSGKTSFKALSSFHPASWSTCDMNYSYVRHDSYICGMTSSYVWHDSFICVTWLIHRGDLTHSCDMTYSYSKPCLAFQPAPWCMRVTTLLVRVTWLIHTIDVILTNVRPALMMCVSLLMTHSCAWHKASLYMP